jgi:NAD(P)-dependent dehydrogenase (short-subunit alcohol dehydrogenase family)
VADAGLALKDKVVAIVGGAGGIGSELSRRYARDGAAVLVGDLNVRSAEAVAASIRSDGGTAEALVVDMADVGSIEAFVNQAESTFGGIDAFHANAAFFDPADLDAVDTSLDSFREMMRVNVEGFFLCTQHAIPAMLRRGGGSMIYTSSGAAYHPFPVRVSYGMAKAAGHALMRHVALRWGKEGIRANSIACGIIMHEELERSAPELRQMALDLALTPYVGHPADIAAMASLLVSDEGRYITGQVLSVDGGGTLRA